MTTRRSFLGGLARGAGALASFRAGALGSVLAAGRSVAGRAADEVAADEDYWREIQLAFTVDRSLVNLNNGGVSPSPRVVQEAMRRFNRNKSRAARALGISRQSLIEKLRRV